MAEVMMSRTRPEFLAVLAEDASVNTIAPAVHAELTAGMVPAAHQGRDSDVDSRLCPADADSQRATAALGSESHWPFKRLRRPSSHVLVLKSAFTSTRRNCPGPPQAWSSICSSSVNTDGSLKPLNIFRRSHVNVSAARRG